MFDGEIVKKLKSNMCLIYITTQTEREDLSVKKVEGESYAGLNSAFFYKYIKRHEVCESSIVLGKSAKAEQQADG